MNTREWADRALKFIFLGLALLFCLIIATPVLVVLFHIEPARDEIHTQAVSPDNRWTVVVTKKSPMGICPTINVWLRIADNSTSPRAWADLQMTYVDLWQDITAESFRIEWKSNHEFTVSLLYAHNPDDKWVLRNGLWQQDSKPKNLLQELNETH